MKHKDLHVTNIARVEGEGSLHLKFQGDEVREARLTIFEPPRFFESLLLGRRLTEAPDITARVCGICPVAYQMSAVHAAENLAHVTVPRSIHDLRRLLYCGEWIASHSLHLFMLHLPDFLGYPSLLAMAKDYRSLVEDGLAIKKTGNAILRLIGGREIHPINVCIGGFHSLPKQEEVENLLPEIQDALQRMHRVIELLVGLTFPELDTDYAWVALRGEGEYPMCEGRIVSSSGLNIKASEFEDRIEEYQIPGSHALYARMYGDGTYVCGPLARLALNFDLLPLDLQDLGRRMGIAGGTHNPFRSILVRALEIIYALTEARRVIMTYDEQWPPQISVSIPEGSARAATEAPRGLLYHRYDVDASGVMTCAKLIPPTSQNQRAMEEDLRRIATANIRAELDQLTQACERAIRNHDPCISCAAHFLQVTTSGASPLDQPLVW